MVNFLVFLSMEDLLFVCLPISFDVLKWPINCEKMKDLISMDDIVEFVIALDGSSYF
jgi:hypothetical protein